VTAAREALTKAPKGKGSAADLAAMTGDVDAAAKTIEEAKADVTAEKYLDAKTKAETAKAQAEKVTADIQAAIDLKKGKK
jgi:sRNA-binding protein